MHALGDRVQVVAVGITSGSPRVSAKQPFERWQAAQVYAQKCEGSLREEFLHFVFIESLAAFRGTFHVAACSSKAAADLKRFRLLQSAAAFLGNPQPLLIMVQRD